MKRATSSDPILQIDGLCKRFHPGHGVVEAVRDVSLTLSHGDFAAVMGASGSGKSTLLHLVAGLTRPDEGTIRIGGTDIHALSERARTVFRRKNIGLVFQAFNLIPTLTGEENIALPMLLGGRSNGSDGVARLVEHLGLSGVRTRRPDSMSGGEQQRFAIARALVTNPSIVLADEPTGSLDSVNGRRLCDTFRKLCLENGTTVLMVTHNPAVAFAAEKILILKDGQLVGQTDRSEYATVQDLAQRYIDLMEADCQEVRG
ncbi:MAG: ABC transporter ATP-binding protein [Planctomycetes bacterium]|nr:ABC transporter ATP-binding protein [Planctomycetota bacterium]